MKDIKIMRVFLFILVIAVFSSCCVKKNAIVAHRGAWKKNNLPEIP